MARPKTPEVPKQQVNIRLDPELRSFAIAVAAQEDKTFGDIVEEALEDYCLRKQESTIARLTQRAQTFKKRKDQRATTPASD